MDRSFVRRVLLSVSAACFAAIPVSWFYDGFVTNSTAIIGFMLLCGALAATAAFWLLGKYGDQIMRVGRYWICIIPALYTAVRYTLMAGPMVEDAVSQWIVWALSAGAVPALYVMFAFAYQMLGQICRALYPTGLAAHERCYFVTHVFIATGFMIWAFVQYPILWDGVRYGNIMSDVVYMFDSQCHMSINDFFYTGAPENDMRNLFFGFFNLPFTAPCMLLSDLIKAVSGVNVYPFLLGLLQCLASVLSAILLARVVSSNPVKRMGFYILFACWFASMLHILILEQYAFNLLWSAAFLHVYITKSGRTNESDACYILAAGNVSTGTLLAIPELLDGVDQAKKTIRHAFVSAVCAMCLSGQILGVVRTLKESLTMAMFCGSGVGLINRLQQFTVFVRSVFLYPESAGFLATPWFEFEQEKYAVWRLSVVELFDLLGVLLIGLAVMGLILNLKDRFARFCGGWLLVSFLILVLIGWGTPENGLIIYGLHFGWAYIGLLFKLLDRIFDKYPAILLCACSIMGVAMLSINLPGIFDMLSFLGQYYPA